MGAITSVVPAAGDGRAPARSLAAAGYTEEEHWVAGTADLYGSDGAVTVVRKEDVPYTTRLVVRKPEPALATGDVLVEPLHPAGDMASSWPRLGAMLLREGWTWIGLTCDVAGLAATKDRDGDRYGHLDLPHRGLGFDVMAQVVAWLRRSREPLPGVRADHVFMSGASYTGTFQRVFLADGFHDRARRPDGRPAVEGYLIQISSGAFMLGGYLPLNGHDPVPPAGDPRRIVRGHDVPVIELLSEGEAETNRDSRRPDADEPGDRYRLYEVPGACHMSAGERGTNLPVRATVEEPSDFPMYALAGGALAALRRWAVDGVTPPRADRIELHDDPDAGPKGSRDEALPAKRDEHGNALGGVRSPHVDVPVARYFPHSTLQNPEEGGRLDIGDLMGSMERFTPERLRALYGTPATYRARYEEGIGRLLDERWILDGDAVRLADYAAAVTF
jgi:hypothetical protein